MPRENSAIPRNGAGAAAILAAGLACFLLGLIAVIADKAAPVKRALIFYQPTGALSGVTTTSIALWLLLWYVLDRRWNSKTVAIGRVNIAAFAFLMLGMLLTFPPFADLF